ncbi:hypothetical protein Ancab_024396 [Ancistrocladus abbreviatus]
MAILPCGTTWPAQWGLQPQLMPKYTMENKLLTYPSCGSSKTKALQSLSSSMFAQDPLHVLFNIRSSRSPCHKRGGGLIVRADSDYYAILGVSKNANKSEINGTFGY